MKKESLDQQSLAALGWPEVIDFLSRQASSPLTAARCRSLPFLDDPEAVRGRPFEKIGRSSLLPLSRSASPFYPRRERGRARWDRIEKHPSLPRSGPGPPGVSLQPEGRCAASFAVRRRIGPARSDSKEDRSRDR